MSKTIRTVALVAASAALSYYAPGLGEALGAQLGISAAAGTAIVTAAGTIAIGAAAAATAPKPQTGRTGPSSYRQSIGDVQIIYGKCRVGGLIAFYHASKVGKFDYRYFVIALAGHEVEGFTKFYLNDEEVTVDGAGLVTSGKYANNCWIWPDAGTATATANATFVSETAGKWTVDHKGCGIAKLYVKFKLTDDVIAEGFPNITAEVEGKNDIYDPRTEESGYTDNAILCAYDWLLTPREDGGFGAEDEEVDWDFVSSQANICDEAVPLKAGGTEPRYTCNGSITAGAAPDDIRDSLLTAFAGEFTYTAGIYKMYAGAWRAPVASLIERDLVADLVISPLSSGDQIANEIRGTFNDPARKYQPTEYPSRSLSTTDDLRTIDLDLPFTKSHTMAQRIAKITLLRANAERSVNWPMNIMGIGVEALDCVTLATSRHGLSNYTWKTMGWGMDESFGVTLALREEDPDFYDWVAADDEQDQTAPSSGIATPAAGEVGNGEAPDDITAGTPATTSVPITFTMPEGTPVGWQVLFGTTNDIAAATVGATGTGYSLAPVSTSVGGLTASTLYYFWALAVNLNGTMSPAAGPVSATTTA